MSLAGLHMLITWLLHFLFQRWSNEEDRVKVLNEKHNRGAAARKVMRERKIKSGYVLKGERCFSLLCYSLPVVFIFIYERFLLVIFLCL